MQTQGCGRLFLLLAAQGLAVIARDPDSWYVVFADRLAVLQNQRCLGSYAEPYKHCYLLPGFIY